MDKTLFLSHLHEFSTAKSRAMALWVCPYVFLLSVCDKGISEHLTLI